ncbi:MAG TPA: PQQ-binding-like beta-propeller repeat protein [Steroidobacteraceae bacterium]|jgi:polyvinyl alcohol dehydrogenase (cytochrome)|nr:PQQ-binding-like beta-propeller repeat protein [Steroidobacteraceae bacterium]
MTDSIELRKRLFSRSMGVLAFVSAVAGTAVRGADWPSAGADLYNSHFQPAETRLSTKTVPNLHVQWTFSTAGDVTAIPAVVGGFVYFPDTAGYIYKVNASTGAQVWRSANVSSITCVAGDFARTTPAITSDGLTLIIGTQTGKLWGTPNTCLNTSTQPYVVALNTSDGSLKWKTVADSTAQAMVTTSAVLTPATSAHSQGLAIFGVASNEELTAAFVPPGYWQWTFRGSALALDVATGAVAWQTFTVPSGYYGGSVWGSTPAVDLVNNQVFVSSGDNYMVPSSVLNCLATVVGSPATCLDPADYFDSIIALDISTGTIKWGGHGMPADVWNVACGLGVPGFMIGIGYPGVYGNCPDPTGAQNPKIEGPDYDFGQGPMLFSDTGSYTDRGLVGAGSKSGIFWAFDAKHGKTVWSTQVSPGGVTGGMQWGSATDGSTIYVSASNAGTALSGAGQSPKPWTLANGQVVYRGGWAAVDASSGKVKWTTADPNGTSAVEGYRAEGPVTLANDVAFGCDMTGTMFALSAKSGSVLWQYTDPAASPNNPCIAGAAVANGMVFWGSGNGRGTGPNKLYAFGL